MWELLAIVILILLLLAIFWHASEGFTNVVYLDQMAMKYSDPMYFKYSSWERDIDGMSPRDYYLENQMNYQNEISPGYFVGDQLYVDHTDYLNMPPWYRPPKAPGCACRTHIPTGVPVQESGESRRSKTPLDTKTCGAAAMETAVKNRLRGRIEQDVDMAYLQEGMY